MLDKYIIEQPIITDLLKKSLDTDKLVQAYLFNCDDINYIYNYAKDFVKEIIKKSNNSDEVLEKIYKRVDKEEYTELKIVEPDGNFIKKEQLLELQNSVVNKPVEGNKIVYIIKNCEKLNSSSANSILKFLEEPSNDIIAILLTDNINMVIPTIKSRCQILNFKNMRNEVEEEDRLKKFILFENVQKSDEEIDALISSTFDAIKYLEKNKKNTFIYQKNIFNNNFNDSIDILIMLNIFLYSYVDSLYSSMNRKINYLFDHQDIIEYISSVNNVDSIIAKINIIEEIKNELNVNVNSKLIFDKLIIELSEV